MKEKTRNMSDLFILLYHIKKMEEKDIITPSQYLKISERIRHDYYDCA